MRDWLVPFSILSHDDSFACIISLSLVTEIIEVYVQDVTVKFNFGSGLTQKGKRRASSADSDSPSHRHHHLVLCRRRQSKRRSPTRIFCALSAL